MKKWIVAAAIYIVFSLLVGYLIASQINGFLNIQVSPKELPEIPPLEAEMELGVFDELAPIEAVVFPEGAGDHPLYLPAIEELVQAFELRTGQAPIMVSEDDLQSLDRLVQLSFQPDAGTSRPGSRVDLESFSLQASGGNVVIAATNPLGHVYGMYELANRLRAGISQQEFDTLDAQVSPAMNYRLVDPGAVGIEPDPAAWSGEDYRHVSLAFQEAMLAEPPYIDAERMAAYTEQMDAYVQKMMSYGYNGIIIDGFLEFVDFDKVGDGYQVYSADSPYRPRQEAMRQAFGELFQRINDQGMMVILKTDMLAHSSPLQEYFQRELGGINAGDPALWQVYQQGLAELFETFPFLEGLMIRIGEAGTIYNVEGWDYSSSLDVKSIEAVRLMLEAFTGTATQYDKNIFFRTWSVGVGQAGDMHTNPETYDRLLGDFNPANLVVSTKLVMGDYYSYIPFNPTLRSGEHRRIIEFQARREFEAFNNFPNYMGPDHQEALNTLMSANPNIEGMWVWTQGGGPLRAGPMTLYPFHGFWQTYDDNVYATARLGLDPAADLNAITGDWVRRTLSDDPETVAKLSQMLALSHEAVLQGLYVRPFAEQQVLAMGLEPPPMLWIFEWDIVSGSSSALSSTYDVAKDRMEDAVAEGFEALALVEQMRQLVQDTDQDTYHDPALRASLLEALEYERDLFEVLAWWRQTFLSYYRWLDTGDVEALGRWRDSLDTFEELQRVHLERYGQDVSFPAYNFFAVEVSNTLASRSTVMTRLARLVLGLMVVTLIAGTSTIQRRLPGKPAKSGLRSLFLGVFKPWRLGRNVDEQQSGWLWAVGWALLLVFAARLLYASFYAWVYLAFTMMALILFILVFLLINRKPSMRAISFALAGGLLIQTLVLLVVISVRGPGYLWLRFWTSGDFRLIFITLTAAAALWLMFSIITAQRVAYGRRLLGGLGVLLLANGMPMAVIGLLVHLLGLDNVLTAFNDQMAILPLGLSRILGITTHLDIPKDLALYGGIFGLLLAGLGTTGYLVELRASQENIGVNSQH